MNAFEDIVAYYFEEEGYWVRKTVKVNISKEEKKLIGLPSMPRPEIDLVALKVKENLSGRRPARAGSLRGLPGSRSQRVLDVAGAQPSDACGTGRRRM